MVSTGPSTVSFRTSGANPDQILSLKIFENDGQASCYDADTSFAVDSFAEAQACPRGNLGFRNLVDRNLEIDDSYDGRFAALVDESNSIYSCCELIVRECPDRNQQ